MRLCVSSCPERIYVCRRSPKGRGGTVILYKVATEGEAVQMTDWGDKKRVWLLHRAHFPR